MIPDLVALCTVAYVVIDDLYQAYLAPLDRRLGPRGRCSDSEIIAPTLVAELVGLDKEVAFLAYLRRNHPTLFPRLPERSRSTRRRRALQEATGGLRRLIQRRVWAALPADQRDLCVIDSCPCPSSAPPTPAAATAGAATCSALRRSVCCTSNPRTYCSLRSCASRRPKSGAKAA